ncbi:hypothetical protein CFC21_060461 [Triticum aestivum]|uniref:Uncharacterized protein n=2 Tax=Triticum aestivum TaxID=4565 RepID=A0A9R1GT04_WHEAT|nr:hypothetical protein CFC21_060461 [Triticum aestivum]
MRGSHMIIVGLLLLVLASGTATTSTTGGYLTGTNCIVKTPMPCDEIKRCIDTCNSLSPVHSKPEISCVDKQCKCTFC